MADLLSYPVSPKYWKSAKRKGWDEPTKNLGMYLLCCEHRNLEGLYYLPKLYAMADLGWGQEELERCFGVILLDGFVMYDEDAEVVLLPKALAFRAPTTKNHMKGALNALSLVPDTTLWPNFLVSAREYAPSFFEFLGGDDELRKFLSNNPSECVDLNPSETHPNAFPEAA